MQVVSLILRMPKSVSLVMTMGFGVEKIARLDTVIFINMMDTSWELLCIAVPSAQKKVIAISRAPIQNHVRSS